MRVTERDPPGDITDKGTSNSVITLPDCLHNNSAKQAAINESVAPVDAENDQGISSPRSLLVVDCAMIVFVIARRLFWSSNQDKGKGGLGPLPEKLIALMISGMIRVLYFSFFGRPKKKSLLSSLL